MADLGDLPFTEFCGAFGVELFSWQREAFGAASSRLDGRFVYRVAAISVPRGDGKSYATAAYGLWRLTCGPPPQDILGAALDVEGARVVLNHAKRIVRSHSILEREIEIRSHSLHARSTGSRWTVTTREHTASRGRHPTLVLYDEVGWARDEELFSSLLAGQASVADPQMIVISTVGRRQAGPLWTTKMLAEGGADDVLWWYSSRNRSPLVTTEFLARQRRILMPAQFAREHENQWVDAADSFTTAAQVDAAMGREGWMECLEGAPGQSFVAFVDLGAVHDPSVIAIGHRECSAVYIDRLITFQGSKESPVRIASVEEELKDLTRRFALTRIRIESWQGLSAVQSLERQGLPVELYTPTAKSNAEEWPVLAQALATGTLFLPVHLRLREELLNLYVDLGSSGVRVVDRGKVHQDHAVAVRGVVAMLSRRPSSPSWASLYGRGGTFVHEDGSLRPDGAIR